MKNLLSFLLVALLSTSLFAQKSVELRYNLEIGKNYKAKAVVVQDQKSTVQGMERSTENTNTTYVSIKALNAQDDFFMAEVRFDTILSVNTVPPMNINSSNSGNIESENPAEVMEAVFNRFSKIPLVVKMDYSGHVLDIMNYNLVSETVLAGLDSLKGQAKMAKPQIEMGMEKESIKSMIESFTINLPNKEIKKKESWESVKIKSAGGASMEIKSVSTLNEVDKKMASLAYDVTINPADGEPMIMNGAEIKTEMRGLGKGESTVDIKTGWIINGTSTMNMTGESQVSAPGYNMTIPVEIIMTTEVTAL